MLYLSAFILFIIFFLAKSLTQYKKIALLISLLFYLQSLLLVIYVVIDQLTGNGINESVYYHLVMESEGVGIGEFWKLISVSIVMIIALLILSICLYKRILFDETNKKIQKILSLALLASLLLINPTITQTVDLIIQMQPKEGYVHKPKDYILIDPQTVKGSKKNLVYIYLESVERTYLDEVLFPNLMPNIQKLEEDSISFNNLEQVYGTGWTIAGIVNTQCGIPLVIDSGNGNAMNAMKEFLPSAVCLGDILKASGYDLTFMGGANLAFAGKGKFFKTHGFDHVYGLNELQNKLVDQGYKSAWGLYDDTIFDIVKNQYDRLSQIDKPFALFTLNVDTHHPNGHTNKFCQNIKYKDGSNPMLNAIHCTDILVGMLVDYIKSTEQYDNTIIVISSDHLAMPNSAKELLDQGDRKNLFFIMGGDLSVEQISTRGTLMDVAPTILSILGFDLKGLGFGRNLLSDNSSLHSTVEDFNEYLKSNREYIVNLWKYPDINLGMYFDLDNQLVQFGVDSYIQIPFMMTFDDELKTESILLQEREKLRNNIPNIGAKQKIIWVDQCKEINLILSQKLYGDICFFQGFFGGKNNFFETVTNKRIFTLDELKNSFQKDKEISDDKRYFALLKQLDNSLKYGANSTHYYLDNIQNLNQEMSIISQGGFTDSFQTHVISTETKNINFNRGITLLGIRDKIEILQKIDTCGKDIAEETYNFKEDMDLLHNDYNAFAIVVHDSAMCGTTKDLSNLFKGLDLEKWKQIGLRTPYIALISKSQQNEFVGESESNIVLHLK